MKKPPGLNKAHSKFIIKVMSRVQTFIYKKTGGKLGGRFLHNAPVAILTTIGRQSGKERSTPLHEPGAPRHSRSRAPGFVLAQITVVMP